MRLIGNGREGYRQGLKMTGHPDYVIIRNMQGKRRISIEEWLSYKIGVRFNLTVEDRIEFFKDLGACLRWRRSKR